MLYTKCILAPKKRSDGARISIIPRHTLENGITSHPGISKRSYDEHIKQLSPTRSILGIYYKNGEFWTEFKNRYLTHIRQRKIRRHVQKLAKRALRENITLLGIQIYADRCTRRLLAEECKGYVPSLQICVDTSPGYNPILER
jgi:uncharacterized protein YeaO (DUF488 family)